MLVDQVVAGAFEQPKRWWVQAVGGKTIQPWVGGVERVKGHLRAEHQERPLQLLLTGTHRYFALTYKGPGLTAFYQVHTSFN